NLLLSFTDVVLPGNAGMDLRLGHTFNKQTNIWTFGIAGIPMEVVEPDAPAPDGTPHPPKLRMADGNIYETHPYSSRDATDVWITTQFWRYTMPAQRTQSGFSQSPVVDLPNGWSATYSHDFGRALLQEVHDPYGNQITVEWDTYDPHDL